MIPIIVPLTEDEDITGWAHYLAEINGIDVRDFLKLFLGSYYNRKNPIHHYISNLEQISHDLQEFLPPLYDILFQHTPIMADTVLGNMVVQTRTIDAVLHGIHDDDIITPLYRKSLLYCPQCAQDDLAKYGRVVLHAPHQITGMKACWKHRYLLATDYTIQRLATDTDLQVAQFLHEIFTAQLFGDIANAKQFLNREDRHSPYTYKVLQRELYKVQHFGGASNRVLNYLAATIDPHDFISQYPADARSNILDCEKRINQSGLSVIFWEYPFVHVRCNACGNEFVQYYNAINIGIGCPTCSSNETWEERTIKCLKTFLPDDFTIIGFIDKQTVQLHHNACNQIIERSVRTLSISRFCYCDCRSHIGEVNTMSCGLSAKIIAYRGYYDIDIQFETGCVRSHVNYDLFQKGTIVDSDIPLIERYRSLRIGERRLMSCGKTAEIIAYRGVRDIDIKFDSGEIRNSVSYQSFCSGSIKPKSEKDKAIDRLGETRRMRCGLTATIVKYRSSMDIDILFETGDLRTHLQYNGFLCGQYNPVSREELGLRRIGERRMMNCGIYAELVAWRSARDIDVLFDNGKKREHCFYRAFCYGQINPVKKEQKKK